MNIDKIELNNVKCLGKLPNSSYFDKPNKVLCQQTLAFIESPLVVNQPNIPLCNNDLNLYVRSCVFSKDGTYLAWISGYKIVKIMKYNKDSSQSLLKRSFSKNDSENSEFLGIKSNNLETNDITEIECNEIVKSLAFGSSNSQDVSRRIHHRIKSTDTRFNMGDNNLLLAVGLISGKIQIFDATCNSLIVNLRDHTDIINDLKFTQDGSLQLMSASNDESIKLWNIHQDGNMYKTLKGHAGKVNMVDWSPIAKLVCSVGQNRQVFIWDTDIFKVKYALKGHMHHVSSCKFSPDGTLVATASYDTKILLWNPFSGELIKQLNHMLPPPSLIYAGGDNGAYIRDFSFSKYGDHIVSICDDKKIRVWSLSTRSALPTAVGDMNEIGLSCAYLSQNRCIIVGNRNGHVDLYKTQLVLPRLVDICRKSVNKQLIKPASQLNLPNELKKFLLYDDIRDDLHKNPNKQSSFMQSMTSGSNLVLQGTARCN